MARNKKQPFINPKKIPRNLALILLTSGASLILGLLSFGGMYALTPFLPLAFATFGLSVSYEGEIYLQNLKGAFKKLFKMNYLENYLGREYLLEKFPYDELQNQDCPQFFRDYAERLKLLQDFDEKQLNKESKQRKRQIEKELGDMEKWFALQLFAKKNAASPYAQELKDWLAKQEQQEWQEKLEQRKKSYNLVKGFSALAGAFMALGSTYLIVEAFSVIPVMAAIPFAFWPMMILPMALIAGVAYGKLTFNTVTDLINNDTIRKWYKTLRDDLSQGLTARNLFVATMAVFLVGLAIALTVCTAGTWWTVATNAKPLFEWMKKMPSFIMGVINPMVTGLSAIFFNVQNSAESLEMIDTAMRSGKNPLVSAYEAIKSGLAHVAATENWGQILNPFRLLIKLTVTPLRILLFLGHLTSIAFTSDRMPGFPQILSVLIGMVSEGFEDARYFFPEGQPVKNGAKDLRTLMKEHLNPEANEGNHTDIPTQILQFLSTPLYALSTGWDYLASWFNSAEDKEHPQQKPLTWNQAWNKQRGIIEEVDVALPEQAKKPASKEWQIEHTVFLIEKHQKKHLQKVWVDTELAEQKIAALDKVIIKVQKTATSGKSLEDVLDTAKKKPIFNKHRLFAVSKDQETTTQALMEDLPERVHAVV